MMTLKKAMMEVRSAYPTGPADLLALRKHICAVNIFDQRALDIVDRFRSASMAGQWHDTAFTTEVKIAFTEKYKAEAEF